MGRLLPPMLTFALAFGLIAGTILVGCNPSSERSTQRPNIYQQVISAKTLRAGYAVGAPLLIIDPNTSDKSGIFYEIVTEAASRLQLTVNWNEEVGYGQMPEALNSGRFDVVGSGVWINPERGRVADFTIPLYYDAVFAFAKTGDERFKGNLQQLDAPEFVISTMDGELGAAIAQKDFPRAKTLQLPQNADFTQIIQNVVDKKADVVFLAAAAGREYQAANPGRISIIQPDKPVRVFPDAIMLPKGQYELKQALDYALTEMINDGTIDHILDKYEKVSGSFLRLAPPYRTSSGSK